MEKNVKEFKCVLENRVSECNKVFITPHSNIDFDAIGAAIGMAEIVKHIGKPVVLVVDDNLVTMTAGIRSIYKPALNMYTVIKSSDIANHSTGNDLLVAVDVNKTNLIPPSLKDQLSAFSHVVILDHHKEDEYTIPTEFKLIDITVSSTCEMITRLFRLLNMPVDKTLAKTFLAGIFLDTNKLQKNATKGTLEIAAKLISRGVSIQDVNDLFVEDFGNDRKVQHLIDGTTFVPFSIHNVAIIYNKNNPDMIYTQVELAKAADYLLPYKVDASFAIGRIGEDTVGISARSLGGMDIASIMHIFNGGGNEHSAAARVLDTRNIGLVKSQLLKLICREDYYTVAGSLLTTEIQNQQNGISVENEGDKQKVLS